MILAIRALLAILFSLGGIIGGFVLSFTDGMFLGSFVACAGALLAVCVVCVVPDV